MKTSGLDLPEAEAREYWAAQVRHWRVKTGAPVSPLYDELVERVRCVVWQRQGNFTACIVVQTNGTPLVGMAKRFPGRRWELATDAQGRLIRDTAGNPRLRRGAPADPWDANAARGASTFRAVENLARLLGLVTGVKDGERGRRGLAGISGGAARAALDSLAGARG